MHEKNEQTNEQTAEMVRKDHRVIYDNDDNESTRNEWNMQCCEKLTCDTVSISVSSVLCCRSH